MSISEIILEKVIDLSNTVGNMDARLDNIESELKNKKSWVGKVDWVKAGKGIGYIILSIGLAGGGVAGASWLGFFQ